MAYTTLYIDHEPDRASVEGWPGLTVLEFGAPWCGHCIGAQAAIQPVLDTRHDVRHLKIEDGRGKPLGRSYRIKLWPTLVVLRDGREVARTVRPQGEDDVRDALAAASATERDPSPESPPA